MNRQSINVTKLQWFYIVNMINKNVNLIVIVAHAYTYISYFMSSLSRSLSLSDCESMIIIGRIPYFFLQNTFVRQITIHLTLEANL